MNVRKAIPMQPRRFRVLVDTCLRNEAVSYEYNLASKRIVWGGCEVLLPNFAELKERCLRGKSRNDSCRIHAVLRRVAHLAETGRIQLYDSVELMFEWMGRAGGPSLRRTEFDPFSNVRISRVKAPVERTVVIGACDSKRDFETEKDRWLDTIQEPRFRELKAVINRKHWADAFHLWTAEANDLDCVLTFENKVRNSLANQKRVTSDVEILSPIELASRFDPVYRLQRKVVSAVVKLFPKSGL